MKRIAVLGIGNVLMGDDALGARVVKELEARWVFPEGVELVEAGTPAAGMPALLEGLDAVVVVDTVKLRGAPGELHVLDRARLLAKNPVLPMSPHEPGLREALFALDFQGGGPREVQLVGVIPGRVELEVGLTPAVEAAVPAAIDETLRQLEALGVRPTPRDPPLAPDLWWERGA